MVIYLERVVVYIFPRDSVPPHPRSSSSTRRWTRRCRSTSRSSGSTTLSTSSAPARRPGPPSSLPPWVNEGSPCVEIHAWCSGGSVGLPFVDEPPSTWGFHPPPVISKNSGFVLMLHNLGIGVGHQNKFTPHCFLKCFENVRDTTFSINTPEHKFEFIQTQFTPPPPFQLSRHRGGLCKEGEA